MANLDDLDVTSISEMSNEELINLLQDIRKSRRTNKTTQKKTTSKKKETKIDVDNLSAEAAQKLLEELEGLL